MQTPPLLALPGPSFVEQRRPGALVVGGVPLSVVEEGGAGRGTAWHCWDGAVAVALWLETAEAREALGAPERALELGSGTGLGGLALAAALRCPVLLTDLYEALPALHRNVDAHPTLSALLSVSELDWRALGDLFPVPLVLASDCVWLRELVLPFCATLDAALSAEGTAVLAHQTRSSAVDELLFTQLAERGFSSVEQARPPAAATSSVRIYLLRRQSGSPV